MNNTFGFILILLLTLRVVKANIKTTKFYTESVAEQPDTISFKRVGSSYFGRNGRISQLQCARVCTNEEGCKSVYVDGETCVFGVDDVTAFVEGEVVTPDPNQVLRVKGKIPLR